VAILDDASDHVTLATAASAWINLPRAPMIAHDPEFMNQLTPSRRLSCAARAAQKSAPGEPLWSDAPRVFRMSNGKQLDFQPSRPVARGDRQREYHGLPGPRQRAALLVSIGRIALWLAALISPGLRSDS
jgi:hypothetical protein